MAPTEYVILSITAALVIYDLIAALVGLPTLSHEMKTWGETDNLWFVPLGWSTLFGHFFVPGVPLPAMGVRTALVVLVFLSCVALNLTLVRSTPIWISGAAGLVLGAGLWNQGT